MRPAVRYGFSLCVFMLANFAGMNANADTRDEVNAELSKPVIRGGIVFKNYCALCHGEKGDGVARASKLYNGLNLSIKSGVDVRNYENIVRKGGAGVGKSPYMPMWEQELSEEQVNDVLAYIKVLAAPEKRGQVVFKTNCVLCHGLKGDGNGRAAKLYDPPPADLTHSDKNDQYKEMIIRLGGEAMGRSPFMPIWGEQLSDQEIRDVVAYLRTILTED
jgi:cytochrome c oxidase cbb3-type subunit 3